MSTDLDSIAGKAEQLYASGLCDEAVALLSETLSRQPLRTDVAIRLAEFLVDSGRHAQALDVIGNDRSAQEDSKGLFLIGLCHLALGDSASAESATDRLIEEFSQTPMALSLKGKIAFDALDDERAEQLFRAAIDEDVSCAMAWHGLALLQKRRDDAEGFWGCARKAFCCMPASREIAIAFHESCLAAGTEEQAGADFREAIREHRMNRRLRFLRIDLLLRKARLSEAMAEIESSLVDFGVDDGILGAALSVREKLGPMTIPAPPRPSGSISLCMIVKNEETHLARCLLSAKPLVDEIIVVDTGSSDETRDIARVFGARVYDISWTNDFSKARNFSLSKASGDWILVLDADEVISASDQPAFKALLATSQGVPAAYRIRTRNYSNQANTVGIMSNRGEFPEEEGIGWFPSDKVRLFRNDPRIRFEYPVHELVEQSLQRSKIPIQDCSIAVHHYGTLSNIQTSEKTKNYRKIGQKKLKKNAHNASALKEHAVQLARLGNYAEALDSWQKFVKLQPRSAEAYLNMGTACWNLGRYEDAVSFAEKALRLDPLFKEAKFNMAFSLLLMGRGEEAKACLEGLAGKHPDYLAAQFLFCVACACQQEKAQAKSIFEKLRALPIGEYIGESFIEISKRFLKASRLDYACRTLEAANYFGCAGSEINVLLETCKSAA